MQEPRRLLLVAAAGATTTAAAVLFLTGPVLALGLLYPVLVIAILAGGAGVGSVHLMSSPTTRRSTLLSVTAFAAGMTLATIAFAVYSHFSSLDARDPRHGVIWPIFAIVFIATIVIGVAAFSAAAAVTSTIVKYRRARPGRLPPGV